MAITLNIDPLIEARFRERANAAGLSVDAYIERLVYADQSALDELENLAIDGLNSGEPLETGPGYWEQKHRRLEERLARMTAK